MFFSQGIHRTTESDSRSNLSRSAQLISSLALASICASGAPIQWSQASGGNGHWYEIVRRSDVGGGKTWTDARADALSRTWLGQSGYLVTITSAAENEFLADLLIASEPDATPTAALTPYIGGLLFDGLYRWADGPEANQPFSYANWDTGQPSGDGPTTEIYWFGDARPDLLGKWNDISGRTPNDYIIEYNSTVPEPSTLFSVLMTSIVTGAFLWRQRFLRSSLE